MQVAVIIVGIAEDQVRAVPWIQYRDTLAAAGVDLHLFRDEEAAVAFDRPWDAMLLHVWQDWANERLFRPRQIMPVLERHAAYRARWPETVQIALNHTDMSRRPYCTPYWRPGDLVLYRTPAYDRAELAPLPPDDIWPYEKVWGSPCFQTDVPIRFRAGFIGSGGGPTGYRWKVARATRRVGIGYAPRGKPLRWRRPLPRRVHDWIMSRCRILVCPQGCGEQSSRHWDAWRSGKPVLTDRACASVEMVPGVRLREDVHYLVYDYPDQIPEIVTEWTRPNRRDDLEQLARAGQQAALSYDAEARIVAFFRRAADRTWREEAAAITGHASSARSR